MANCLRLNYGGIKKLLTMWLTLYGQPHERVTVVAVVVFNIINNKVISIAC